MKQRFHTVDGQGAMHTGGGGRDPGAAMVLPKIEFLLHEHSFKTRASPLRTHSNVSLSIKDSSLNLRGIEDLSLKYSFRMRPHYL